MRLDLRRTDHDMSMGIVDHGRGDRLGVRARYADPVESLSDFFSTQLSAALTRGCIAFRLHDMLQMEPLYSDTLPRASQREQRRSVLDLGLRIPIRILRSV